MEYIIPLIALFINLILVHGTSDPKHYIVYMGEHSHKDADAVISANHAMFGAITGSGIEADEQEAITHHYSRSFRGFSAMLTQEQAQKLQECDEVISVFESKMYKVHTTHSWDFLGVHQNGVLGQTMDLGSDVIVGSIDTGIWPESKSFNDQGLGPVPQRFKGECVPGQNFTKSNCNRKIIGARYFYKGFEAAYGPLENQGMLYFRSPRDADGHGTHTATTVAGAVVPNTSMLGIALGTARGGAPGARIAIYKACWFGFCHEADLLSAFDEAVADGVDIISLSAGFDPPQRSYFHDSIAIGSFHAFQKGILVSASAGNSGGYATAGNVAPWILTVAASSMDRTFEAHIRLGNYTVLRGTSLNPEGLNGQHGIIYGSAAAAPNVSAANASYCHNNTLDHKLVSGKIVVCFPQPGVSSAIDLRTDKAVYVKEAGGVGMILVSPVEVGIARFYVIPSALIGDTEAKALHYYLTFERSPVASITTTWTVIGRGRAPEVTVFSSRGPNTITPDIIKPDITAPGLNILAAWSPVAIGDTAGQPLEYFIASGTSMACPHVSAAAAIVKSHHPGWSPSAIMSALMTTATVDDSTGHPILRYPNGSRPTTGTPFDYGSGHLNPVAAVNPGLVYSFGPREVIDFICSNGASSAGLKNLTGKGSRCKGMNSYDLNYPSIGVGHLNGSMSVHRAVKNVQSGRRVYTATVVSPKGVWVRVVPSQLEFSRSGEKKSFKVELLPFKTSNGRVEFGSITWSDGMHNVRSPIGVNVVAL